MIAKCVHRLKIEEIIQSGGTPDETDRCYKCYGYVRTCENYTDLQHLLQFYDLFKQDREVTQCQTHN